MDEGWATLGEVERMTRMQILDANAMLSAIGYARHQLDLRARAEKQQLDRAPPWAK